MGLGDNGLGDNGVGDNGVGDRPLGDNDTESQDENCFKFMNKGSKNPFQCRFWFFAVDIKFHTSLGCELLGIVLICNAAILSYSGKNWSSVEWYARNHVTNSKIG